MRTGILVGEDEDILSFVLDIWTLVAEDEDNVIFSLSKTSEDNVFQNP